MELFLYEYFSEVRISYNSRYSVILNAGVDPGWGSSGSVEPPSPPFDSKFYFFGKFWIPYCIKLLCEGQTHTASLSLQACANSVDPDQTPQNVANFGYRTV